MIKKTVTYVDYNGVERTEDKYFNLSKAELVKMQYSEKGGMAENLQRAIDSNDEQQLMTIFDDLIVKSYGVVSPDGKTFVKNDEIRSEFVNSEAYSEIFMDLISNLDNATEFINGIIPAALRDNSASK